MQLLDWLILILPVCFVMFMGFYSRRYIRCVADYLTCGRICGRYVLGLGDVANALSIIGVVAYIEQVYKTGFAVSFWSRIMVPVSVILGLSGYCTYRFRETKAMSLGQFLEMRYSRNFRIFAAALRSISEMLANMIMPAIAARFFILILHLPTTINILGLHISTFTALITLFLILAISLICMGGTLSLVITDTIQGMFLYPILALFVIFIIWKFSWSGQILPVMADRVAGESFLNPYDISKLRDFNLFSMVILTIFTTFMHAASWTGAGTMCSAKSPHEQKMAGILGTWRNALVSLFMVIIAIGVIAFMNHKDWAPLAHEVRLDMTKTIATDVIKEDPELAQAVIDKINSVPGEVHTIGVDAPLSQEDNIDSRFLENIHETITAEVTARADSDEASQIKAQGQANFFYQQCRTLYYQLCMSSSMRRLLPTGLFGLFVLLLFLAMLSTDDTRIYSAVLTIAQDVIMPLRKKILTPEQHVRMLRWVAVGVGVFFFCGSHMMSQLDYINMFVTITCSLWLSGCGPVMIFGLYSRFGTTAGAWTSLLTGMFISILTFLTQHNWAKVVYPFLARHHLVDITGKVLHYTSLPFHPYIKWEMDAVKCPINSYEFYFFTMLLTLALYCIVSFLTCKKPFNLDRMLHRGKYSLDGERDVSFNWKPSNLIRQPKILLTNILGITKEYTFGDKCIAWSIFAYNFIYGFIVLYLVVIIWNAISPWSAVGWGNFFFYTYLVIPGIIAFISAFWFGIGGTIDLFRLFHDLKARTTVNDLDNGVVEGSMSLADKAELEAVDAQGNGGDAKP